MQKRIVELETQVAFQEDSIEQLSKVISQQQQQLDRLEQEIILIKKHIEDQRPSTTAGTAEEIPPHY